MGTPPKKGKSKMDKLMKKEMIRNNAASSITNMIFEEAYSLYENNLHDNPDECITALQNALPFVKQQSNLHATTHLYLALGACFKVTGNFHQALSYFAEAIQTALHGGIDWAYAEALEQAQLTSLQLNDHASAYSFAKELNRWLKVQLDKQYTEELKTEPKPSDEREQHLAKQQQKIERQQNELQRFGYVVAHDLKEPLHIVSGFCSLIDYKYRNTFTPELKELFGYITTGTKQMHDKLDDLIEYAHINPHPNIEPLETENLVNKALSLLSNRIKEVNASVLVNKPQANTIQGNPQMLLSLLFRLLDNALKFTHPKQTIKIRINISTTDTETVMSISDNGIGIEPEHQGRIFQIFSQLHRQQFPGTGMGLAICQKIVEAHNGNIRVESIVGEGSTFICTFPNSSAQTA
jgi:signal transduction histidine kinase